MKKNVLFVVDEKKMGGVSILLTDILKSIDISKYHIDVLVLHNNGNELNNLPKEVNIIYGTKFFIGVDYTIKNAIKTLNPTIIYSKLRLMYLMKRKKIEKRIVEERKKILKKKYDVEVAFKDGFCALFTIYGDSTLKYHWLHTDYSMYDCTSNYKELFQDILPRFDKIVAISNSVATKFKEIYPVNNVMVIYNIIDKDKIIKMSKEDEIKFDNSKINLISVGRFHEMKGYDRLVRVLNKLNIDKKLDNVVVRLIGDGDQFDLVKKEVEEYNLTDKVLLLGRKSNPFPYVKKSDAFLMCSRYEPFGLVILEAMILKVPVLSLDVLSIREIFSDKYGKIFPNDEDGLYNGILDIINNQSTWKKYHKNLENYDYDVKKIILKIEELLDK